MNYKKLNFQHLNISNSLENFLETYQDQYIEQVLFENKKHPLKKSDTPSKNKGKLRSVLSDFLFAEKYNTVFDMVKFKKKKQ